MTDAFKAAFGVGCLVSLPVLGVRHTICGKGTKKNVELFFLPEKNN
jgi:hypothetical protein